MYDDLLRELGLTENEAKVYLTLLQIGQASSSKIVSEAGISGGKVYETLDKLHQKGLISLTVINGVKQFKATNPDSLISYVNEQQQELDNKEKQLKNILPELVGMQHMVNSKAEVNVLIGTRSVKPLIIDLLNKSKEVVAMGIRGSKDEQYNNFWWHLTNTHFKNKKPKYLFAENKSEYYKKFKKLKFAETKYVEGISPSAMDIFDEDIIILSYDKELTCVHIKNKNMAESFKTFFNSLWQVAK